MEQSRREFLKGTAWMGAAAVAAGCANGLKVCGQGGSMQGFAVAPMKKVRVGVVGIGSRGEGAVHRIAMLPGVEVAALCDIRTARVEVAAKGLKETKRPTPRLFSGTVDGWRRM
jgi:predicted homoserine dehydrogenase-like protein